MTERGDIAEFYRAVADLHQEWRRIEAWAEKLGIPIPAPPGPGQAQKPRISPERAPRRRRKPPVITSSDGEEVSVPIKDLSRPMLCLGILRYAGKSLETQEIIKHAFLLGHDWSKNPGGPSNAVHTALGRNRFNGIVKKEPDGPWRLISPDKAPILDTDHGKATLPAGSSGGVYLSKARRTKLLSLFENGRSLSAVRLLKLIRDIPGFEDTTRSAIREDVKQLARTGKIRKVARGKYAKKEAGM